MITLIAFDFDGTLADSREVVVRIYNSLAQKNGFVPLTFDIVEELRAMSMIERCRRLNVPPHRIPGLVVQVTRAYRKAVQDIRFREGASELLQTLKGQGYKIAVVSTNDERNIRTFLAQEGAETWIDRVYCSSKLFGKAALLRKLMRKEGLSSDQLVYVGDEQRDIVASHEVGVKVIGVIWGLDPLPRLTAANPDAIAERPSDVADIVRGW